MIDGAVADLAAAQLIGNRLEKLPAALGTKCLAADLTTSSCASPLDLQAAIGEAIAPTGHIARTDHARADRRGEIARGVGDRNDETIGDGSAAPTAT